MEITKFATKYPNGFYGFDETNPNNMEGIWNSAVYIDNKIYRERAEVLVIKGTNINNVKVFMRLINKHIPYRIPGGSLKPDKGIFYTATRETQEEARMNIKDVTHMADYLDNAQFQEYKLNDDYDVKVRYSGNYNHVCVAKYDSSYNGEIEFIDTDKDMTKNGRFFKLKDIKSILRTVHISAIVEYLAYDK